MNMQENEEDFFFFFAIFFKFDILKFLTLFMRACKSDQQSPGVFACTPALPVTINEGRVSERPRTLSSGQSTTYN